MASQRYELLAAEYASLAAKIAGIEAWLRALEAQTNQRFAWDAAIINAIIGAIERTKIRTDDILKLNLQADLYNRRAYQAGGYVTGPAGNDNVPAWLSRGEFVIRQASVQSLGLNMLGALNQSGLGAFSPVVEAVSASAEVIVIALARIEQRLMILTATVERSTDAEQRRAVEARVLRPAA
jgi:hypothetical protein